MSDGMAFLTGAAFAGVAVLFMIKGGDNIVANGLTPARQLPIAQANPSNPYDPYMATPPMATPTSPSSSLYDVERQRLDAERLRAMLEQQRTETEQLKAQLQNQQMLIEKLTTQTDPTARPAWSRPTTSAATPVQPQQQENSMVSGIVWALGGMAITISGGIVVVGALAVLARQQRPGRTTYVVQQPYNALPHTLQTRRRSEVMPAQIEDRRVDYVEYDR
jgi:hypothetical protein